MPLTRGSKIWFGILLFELYHLVIWLVAFLNTSVWVTEQPKAQIFHQHGLYEFAKGFNVFFGVTVLLTTIVIAFLIGDWILSIADLRIRAHYNFALFISSFTLVIIIPTLYVLTLRYYAQARYDSFIIEVIMNFVALDAIIIFIQAIFLLLTAMLSTLRSYNIFRYLIKLREQRLNPFRNAPMNSQPNPEGILKRSQRPRLVRQYSIQRMGHHKLESGRITPYNPLNKMLNIQASHVMIQTPTSIKSSHSRSPQILTPTSSSSKQGYYFV